MLSIIAVSVLPCLTLSESLASSSLHGNAKRSMFVSRNGVVRQELAVDSQVLRREKKSDTSLIASERESLDSFESAGFGYGRDDWNYGNQDQWWELVNDAEPCKNTSTSQQSPIALDDSAINISADGSPWNATLDPIYNRWSPLNQGDKIKVVNNGHTIKVVLEDGGNQKNFGQFSLPDGFNVTGGPQNASYMALQYHFHIGTEHVVNGNKQYLMEMQIVHRKVGSQGTNDLAVIAIMLQDSEALGAPRPIAKQTLMLDTMRCDNGALPTAATGSCDACQTSTDADCISKFNISEVFKHELSGQYYHYQGSLTSPPCSEGVHWYVMQRPAAVNTAFIEAFKSKFPSPGNRRALQPRNGRWITMNNVTNPPIVVRTITDDHEFNQSQSL